MKYPSSTLVASLLPRTIASPTTEHDPRPTTDLIISSKIILVTKGEDCGNNSASISICGDRLCCSVHAQICASDDSCGSSICLPQFSTGCIDQGVVNDEYVNRNISANSSSITNTTQILLQSPSDYDHSSTEESSPEKPQTEDISIEEPSDDEDAPGPFPSLDELANLPRPELGSTPYGQVITSCIVPGTLALTFDDGPWKYTADLVGLLDRKRVKATFFVCGSNMEPDQLTRAGHTSLLRHMVNVGHQIGSHTWAHPYMAGLDRDDTAIQMYLNERALVGVLGMVPTYFRPPYLEYGSQTLSVMKQLGYHVITLDVDTEDWKGDYEAAKQNFLDALSWGADSKLVLAHDIHERTVWGLAEWMIDQAEERGYKLVTVGECLGDAPDNWYRDPYDGGTWTRSRPTEAA